ncbi:MAG: xanthine dehydrogenase family protein molybdopterin-binding subunit [Actinobacteria bacterium]|nr:xanthine dehydrogenase family protein molybdopterin-binding subunit [Actinomycetota bacterium]
MSILGTRVLRKEDPRFLTEGGRYVADLVLDGALCATYVRSPMAHAHIVAIDVEEALAAPGVVAVFTADDVDLAPASPPFAGLLPEAMARPWLATDVVRFVGEPVAVILSETRAQGEDAADLVVVDLDPLPAVVDPEDARNDTVVLFPEHGTNVALDLSGGAESDPTLFDECDVVVRLRIVNQRVAPCPLEVRSCAARWETDGRVTVWLSTQAPHAARTKLAEALGLDESEVHVIAPDVGGGFGAKIDPYPEDVLVPWLARRAGRPVRWVETRSESMVALGHGRSQLQLAELGGGRDGRLGAYRLTILQDGGAYPSTGTLLPFLTRSMLCGVYDIPRQECLPISVVTTTTPTVAYRGAGRPEATAAVERAIDRFAAEIGLDPAEVRRRNLIPPTAFPYTNPTGSTYDIGDYERALDIALDTAGYGELRAEQELRRASGDRTQIGIGLSTYVEVTGGAGMKEFGAVEVRPDGSAVVRTGTSPHGQGHVTAWAMLASEQTGIPVERIEVLHGDTDLVPRGEGTMGSRSLQQGGVAVHQAAVAVVERARQLAAELLEASPDDIVLDKEAGRLHVAGTPTAGRSWADLAAAAAGRDGDGDGDGLRAEVDMAAAGTTYPFGAHVVVVEVDTETGHVTVRRIVAVDDAGRILNPLLLQGQVHGGLAQGVAQALLEEVRYDDDGNPLTSNLADYAMISAAELPSFELVNPETPTPLNELGAKGIGESGTIGSTPAVQNAVVDALAHLGVRHVDMPATPERVWRAIVAASS